MPARQSYFLARPVTYSSDADSAPLYGVPPYPAHSISRAPVDSLHTELLADDTLPVLLHGIPGSGKQILALSLAHSEAVRRRFPDGVFWLPMGAEPNILSYMAELRTVFCDVDVHHTDIKPAQFFLRGLLADKQMLLILDDARMPGHISSFQQILSDDSRLLMTSTQADLAILPDVRSFSVEPFAPSEAQQLMRDMLHVDTLPDACQTLIKRLKCQPLAIALAGGYLKQHGIDNAAQLLQQIPSDSDIQTVLHTLYDYLNDTEKQVFRVTGSIASPFDADIITALLPDVTNINALLLHLAEMHLIKRDYATTYRTHEVMWQFARGHLRDSGEMDAVFRRYVQYIIRHADSSQTPVLLIPHMMYAGGTLAGHYRQEPDLHDIALQFAQQTVSYVAAHPEAHTGAWSEMGWSIAEERLNPRHIIAFCDTLGDYHTQHGHPYKARDSYVKALRVYRGEDNEDMPPVDNIAGEAQTLYKLGSVYEGLGQWQTALDYLKQALNLFRQSDTSDGEARTLNRIGRIDHARRNHAAALEKQQQALSIWKQQNNTHGQAQTHQYIGDIHAESDELDDMQQAQTHYQQALNHMRECNDIPGQVVALVVLANIAHRTDDPQTALDYYQQALTHLERIGDKAGQATVQHHIADMYRNLHQPDNALTHYQQALTLNLALGHTARAATTCYNIGMVHHDNGNLSEAVHYVERCVTLNEQVQHPDLESDRRTLRKLRWMQQQTQP